MIKRIKGQNVNLMLDGQVVAASTSCQFTVTANTADASAKDDAGDGMWDNSEFTYCDWSASNESYVVDVNHLLALLHVIVNGDAKVDVAFQLDNELVYGGRAIISQLQLKATNKEHATMSLSLEGASALIHTGGAVISPNMMPRIKGKALMVAIKGEDGTYHTLAASTSHTLTVSVQSSDASTKDDNDGGAVKEVTGKSASLSTENLVAVSDGAADVTGKFLPGLLEDTLAGKVLKMSIGYYAGAIGAPAGSDADWGTGTPLLVYGDFLCTNISVNAANKENATFSAEFACKGMPSVGSVQQGNEEEEPKDEPESPTPGGGDDSEGGEGSLE